MFLDKRVLVSFVVVTALLVAVGMVTAQGPAPNGGLMPSANVGYAFTYQGQLKHGNNPVTGSCDMAFRLYNDPLAGSIIGSLLTPTVPVTNGLFTVALDFGNSTFDGNPRWLSVNVNCGSGSTQLTPRQPLTAAPYALSLIPGAVISGSLLNELTAFATTAQYGNPSALHGIADGQANLFPAIPIAVWGESHSGAGLLGASDTANAVLAYSHAAGGNGVYGSNDGGGAGVYGYATTGNGVYGTTANSSGSVAAVYGVNTGGGYGVSGASTNISVYAHNTANSTTAYLGSPCCAADLYGAVNVTGSFNQSNGTKNFMMDDPLDPGNKYLLHAAVEAPNMTNLYDGIATLDERGEAMVQLPQWFGAINTDFRYQLTAVGAPMPNLYIAEEIQHNRFKIAGGKAGGKVSWQVTATRNDAWAAQHPFQAEQDKPAAERGTYLYPQGFGQPLTTTVRMARYGQ